MKKNISKVASLCMISVAIGFLGCGGDRSSLYDGEGNQIDISGHTVVPYIDQTTAGLEMLSNNFVYIPGGFDVDGDGIQENGFWLAKYEARESNQTIDMTGIGSVEDVIRNNFELYNKVSKRFDLPLGENSSYLMTDVADVENLEAHKIYFSAEGDPVGMYSPIEATIAIANSQVVPKWPIALPSEKQWMQLVQLVINNPENWQSGVIGEGSLYQGSTLDDTGRAYFVIANNILGKDSQVSDAYVTKVYGLAGGLSEWTKGMIAKEDRFLGGASGENEYTLLDNAPNWWKPILKDALSPLNSTFGVGKYHDGSSLDGANDILEITQYGTGDVDDYAVILRGGSSSVGDSSLVGISAAKLNYGPGYKDPKIGFRASSGYIESE